MRNFVIFGSQDAGPLSRSSRQRVTVDGVTIECGLVPTRQPVFDPHRPELAEMVLVKVSAFSCNYRDKAFVRGMRGMPAQRFSTVGSEFVGRVLQVGSAVKELAPGDRVVSNHHFAGTAFDSDGVRAGIATNQASRGHQLLPARKLKRVPDQMPDDVAAMFSLNAQTAYSMVRRLDLTPGANVLVTSGTSNTSLFIIAALKQHSVNVFASTSTSHQASRLIEVGAHKVMHVQRNLAGFRDSADVNAFGEAVGGFDYVLDPFFDLHIEKAVEILNPFGKYITCGLVAQNEHAAAVAGVTSAPPDSSKILFQAMMKNLCIMGNCIGLGSDLDAAMQDYTAGTFRPVVDSVYSGDDASGFMNRTFNDSSRFGKVVFRYAA